MRSAAGGIGVTGAMLAGAKVFHTSGVGVGKAAAVASASAGKTSGVGVPAELRQPVRAVMAAKSAKKHLA